MFLKKMATVGLSGLMTVVSLIAVSSAVSSAETQKQVFSIQLSRAHEIQKRQLATLSQFDILGISHAQNIADVRLSGQEYRDLSDAGFDISFATTFGVAENGGASIQDYLTPATLTEKLKKLASENKDIARLESIGKTSEGLDIWAIEITANLQNAAEANKPSVLFNSMHHARELMTAEVAFDIAETLIREFRENGETTELLEKLKVIVVPQVNPDGNNRVHAGQNLWRKNSWKYKGNVVGVDLNRNYPAFWNSCNGSSGSRGSDSYRGPRAASEPETQAMINLVKTKKPVANISYHAFSELIIFPFGCNNVNNPSRDLFEKIGASMNKAIKNDEGVSGTYKIGPAPEVIYAADGTDVDWQWKEAGVVSFAIEVNSRKLGFQPDYKQWRDITVERQRGGWKSLLNSVASGLVRLELPSANAKIEMVKLQVSRKGTNGLVAFDADRPDFRITRPVRWHQGRAYAELLVGEGQFEVSTEAAE